MTNYALSPERKGGGIKKISRKTKREGGENRCGCVNCAIESPDIFPSLKYVIFFRAFSFYDSKSTVTLLFCRCYRKERYSNEKIIFFKKREIFTKILVHSSCDSVQYHP
jgi:hypothetical protein